MCTALTASLATAQVPEVDGVPPLDRTGHAHLHADADLEYSIEHGSTELVVQLRRAQKLPEDLPLMPGFAGLFSAEDTSALIAYIKSLWTDDQRRTQQSIPRRLITDS